MKPVLIIDDEKDIRELIEITLLRMGIPTLTAGNVGNAKDIIAKNELALCLTDMKLPDGSGMDIIHFIQQQNVKVPVAMITAFGSTELAVQALKAGAFDFISKPVDIHQLRELVSNAIKLDEPKNTVQPKSMLIGESSVISQLNKKIAKLARSQAPVFVRGESGSGKELVARSIHQLGPRTDAPFIAVNCGAIPEGLMESEFFGHKKGSFTGASSDKIGFFQAAHGGTLFLDEVADLPLDMQVKLLRAIQEKAIRPVGDQHEVHVDVRLLSATHKDLTQLIEQQRFREDLYYRINVIELNVPPLRERERDLLLIAKAILVKLANAYQSEQASLDKSAEKALLSYEFPGNVRELENILERAYALCDGEIITADDLEFNQRNQPMPTMSMHANRVESRPSSMPLEEYLEQIERDEIEAALEACRWNKTEAAKMMGMTFRSLRYRLKKLGID